ncbi:phosphate/phosphite/phosphonate ABC transporter substrate-binding protein [Ruania halotolerans]|uniref:phosphate/phosphite/phosphonate ABC transporter substrate-binding protein n=1 Tax=Ruania halotolerans TaxID=2897773 RepID=UPI001E5B1170|nr:phosphate/phosphite/phosphonate ABC transporter substrate-binding protein [Ruania halotolerans]UFU05391.1 phosphate/phosphite/phosphonate ABC transporter substrate-binding protein [Ruania halotolerans]
MKRAMRWAAIGAAAALALTACASDEPAEDETGGEQTGGDEEMADPEEIVLGLVPSQEMDSLVEDADQLGALIEAELGIPVTTNVTENYAALVTAMQTGQAQIGMFGPIALVQAADQADAEIILQSVRFGSSTYHTQWFTNDPDTYCLDDVVEVENEDGSTYTFCNGADAAEAGPAGEDALALIEQDTPISMVDSSSASGYYYPATQLERVAGLDPLALNTQFAGGHPNSIINVASGDYPVGVSFDDARDNVVEENPQIGEEVTVFAYSDEIPNDGVAVAGDLSEDLQQRIADAMVAVMETEEGAAAYDAVYSIEGLVPADLDALDAARQVEANFAGL